MLGQNKSTELHTWVEARLSDYIDQQLPASERARMEQHLGGCAQCRASLESMQWSMSLLKQAPAPASRRNFVLPVPAPRTRPAFAFGAVRWATALATLALIAVIGIDVINQMGSSASPVSMSAPAAAPIQAMPTTVAIAPTAAPQPTLQPKAAGAPPPASSSAAASSAASSAPAPAPQFAAPTPTRPAAAAGALETAPTQSANDAAKTQTGRAPVSSTLTASPTASPTATLAPTITPVPPTETPAPTMIAQVRETVTPLPLVATDNVTPAILPPVRIAEIALLFAAIFFGTLMLLLWRQK